MAGICLRCHAPVAGEAFCGNCGQPNAAARAGRGHNVAGLVPEARPAADMWAAGRRDPVLDAVPAGQAGQDVSYRGLRLAYDKVPEDPFDPIGNPRLLRQFGRHALLYLLVYSSAAVLFGIVLLIAGTGIGYRAAITLWWIGAASVGFLFLCLFWLIPVPAQLSEWKFLVDGQASIAPVAFDHIAWALERRETPLDEVKIRRLKLAGGESRDYLEVRRGLFSGLVSCFAYGQDLYLGWTFWLRISPLRCALMMLARLWQTLQRRGNDLYVSLRYDYARAMREAVHSATREGVEVATGQERPQGQGIGE